VRRSFAACPQNCLLGPASPDLKRRAPRLADVAYRRGVFPSSSSTGLLLRCRRPKDGPWSKTYVKAPCAAGKSTGLLAPSGFTVDVASYTPSPKAANETPCLARTAKKNPKKPVAAQKPRDEGRSYQAGSCPWDQVKALTRTGKSRTLPPLIKGGVATAEGTRALRCSTRRRDLRSPPNHGVRSSSHGPGPARRSLPDVVKGRRSVRAPGLVMAASCAGCRISSRRLALGAQIRSGRLGASLALAGAWGRRPGSMGLVRAGPFELLERKVRPAASKNPLGPLRVVRRTGRAAPVNPPAAGRLGDARRLSAAFFSFFPPCWEDAPEPLRLFNVPTPR